MATYNLAIELGSSNTVIYKAGQGIVLKEPSKIAINVSGKKINVECTGIAAKKLIGKTNNTLEIISPIVEGEIVNLNMCKLMLKDFLNRINNNKIAKNKVLFIIPCGLNYEEKQKIKNLAYSLNISTVGLIPAAICGLVGMEVEANDPRSHMIINMGGGVTDIAVVNNNRILRGATINIGGDGIDYNIGMYVKNKYNVNLESVSLEQIKNQIGTLLNNDISSINIVGSTINTKFRQEIRLFSKDVYPIMVAAFNRICEASETILNMCSSEVLNDINKFGVYVCGGLSNITGVEKFLSNILKLPVYIAPEPDNSVILGAGSLLNNPDLLNTLII